MWVGEPRESGSLPFEPLRTEYRAQLRSEQFDGYLAVVLEVLSEIDRAHAPFAERPLDPVAVGQGGGELLREVRHRGSVKRNLRRNPLNMRPARAYPSTPAASGRSAVPTQGLRSHHPVEPGITVVLVPAERGPLQVARDTDISRGMGNGAEVLDLTRAREPEQGDGLLAGPDPKQQ